MTPPVSKLLSKVANLALHPQNHRWDLSRTRCNICGRRTLFLCDDASERWIRKCVWCRSTPKYRAIAWVLERHLGRSITDYLGLTTHALYELTTTSPLHRCHRWRTNYVCSAYFSDRPFKKELAPRVWNEDVQDLHFPDHSFDVIVSSETMEHVRKPWQGFREIHRVLKPGGVHCFTIPYYPAQATVARVDTSGPTDVDVLPRVYHEDPYRTQDSLVFTDFGADLCDLLKPIGFCTTEHLVQDGPCDIHDDMRPMRVFLSEKGPNAGG